MELHNALPHFLKDLARWEEFPARAEFAAHLAPLSQWLAPLLSDFADYRGVEFYDFAHAELGEGDAWAKYRAHALGGLSPEREEARARAEVARVERLLGVKLAGEIVLFGAFTLMDGYARFERGTHRVFLGVDEFYADGNYLDILFAHELTHVAREAKPAVWEGWGLSPTMSRAEFTRDYPKLEHLFNEGFACVVSEAAHAGPDERAPWKYVYQTEESWRDFCQPATLAAIDRKIHAVLADPSRSHPELYDTSSYGVPVPDFAHYAWAWAWAKSRCTRPLSEMVGISSHTWHEDALAFSLADALNGARTRS